MQLGHHHHNHGISRRALLQGAAATGVAVAASGLITPGRANAADPRPKPIPGGILPIAHVNGPGPATGSDPATIDDDSTIYDFDGVLVTSHIQGTGTGTDLMTGLDIPLSFDTDQRFMHGTYIAEDGVTRQGTFGFI